MQLDTTITMTMVVGLIGTMLTQFAVGVWWASKITETIKQIVATLAELKGSMKEGMFPSCVRHTHQIKTIGDDIREMRLDVSKLHERIDAMHPPVNGRGNAGW